MAYRWSGVTIDCVDPGRLSTFWSELLGREATDVSDDWVYLGSRSDAEPRLVFQRVPEARTGKVRIHLDVTVDDIGEGRARVEELGGSWTGVRNDHPGGIVLNMLDPEGHEFCLVEYLDS